ncbi:hypothetical protein BC940DRAFT_297814 [Gongronella butleri]|nr:hypothetical protein BC940DRAFT_297814 [Gongronella butleri]
MQPPLLNDTPDPLLIGLQIKSLEQPTHSVRLPRNSSVLELKNVIQTTLDVDSGRQRLIFQGKVLKDDKNLMDYANLDDGKVVHLVVRPLDAPHNPMNDEPQSQQRRRQRATGAPFASLASRFPLMEGITFITLDAHIGGPGMDHPSFASLFQGLTGGTPQAAGTTTTTSHSSSSTTTTTNSTPTRPATRSTTTNTMPANAPLSSAASSLFPGLFARSIERRRSNESLGANSNNNSQNNTSTTNTAANANASTSFTGSSRMPFPSSVEMRLSRTIAYIRNVRNILDAPADQQMSQIPYTSASSAEFIQEIRSMLRGEGNSQSHQVGMVMNELADLMEQGAPWLRETAQELQSTAQQPNDNTPLFYRVLRAARIVQGMSLIHHFLGSVLASADMDGRRQQTNQDANFILPNVLWPPDTNATRPATSTPTTRSTSTTTTTVTPPTRASSRPVSVSTTTTTQSTRRSSSSSSSSSSASQQGSSGRGSKRRNTSRDDESSNKRHAKGKQRESKDKTE